MVDGKSFHPHKDAGDQQSEDKLFRRIGAVKHKKWRSTDCKISPQFEKKMEKRLKK